MNEDAMLDSYYEDRHALPDEDYAGDMGDENRDEDYEDEDPRGSDEGMDPSDADALASAGFGTEEDYGYYGGDEGDW